MMTPFGRLLRDLRPQGLMTLGDQLVVCEDMRHALLADQTVGDALGGEGWAVRQKAAFEASEALLGSIIANLGADTADAKLSLATEIFAALGHGLLMFDLSAEGGTARGAALYHGHGYLEQSGEKLRNRKPLCAFTAGFCSAAASLAFPSDWGALGAEEVSCVGRGDAECVFELTRRPERPRPGATITREAAAALPWSAEDGLLADRVEAAATKTWRIVDTLAADHAGSVRAFGTRLAVVPASYIGQLTFDTMHLVEKRWPDLAQVLAGLFCEASTAGAFHLLGGILTSDAWKTETPSGLSADPHERLADLVGASRALGWGGFHIAAFTPGASLTLAAPVTHESAYYAARHGSTIRPRLVFQQGVAAAMLLLVDALDPKRRNDAPMGPHEYRDLAASGAAARVEEIGSVLRGDARCEVIAHKRSS